jgi:hypothetical protein
VSHGAAGRSARTETAEYVVGGGRNRIDYDNFELDQSMSSQPQIEWNLSSFVFSETFSLGFICFHVSILRERLTGLIVSGDADT